MPVLSEYYLNGVSSNTQGDLDREARYAFDSIADTLQGHEPGQIMFVVSTADGLWTNIQTFKDYFSPYKHLDLVYCVHEAEGRYRLLGVSDLIDAIDDVLQRVRIISPAHLLVSEWNEIAIHKLT